MGKHQNNEGVIPVWIGYALTISEASAYYLIGENKLWIIADEHPESDFIIMNGNRVLIKRHKFEQYLDHATVV